MILGWIDEAQANGARLRPACKEVGLAATTILRWRGQPGGGDDMRHGPKTTPKNKLSEKQRGRLLEVANGPAFRNQSPKQIVPALADAGQYIASESTFYRILREEKQLAHRGRAKPRVSQPPSEHRATGPNQVWSWDITYLKSAVAGSFFYLYLFVDVWSRKIVSWEVHDRESDELSSEMLERVEKQHGSIAQLVVHSDNGHPMKGATMKATMERLGVLPSYSRPHVSNDNPYSESLFRTLKYRPNYPKKPFGSIDDATAWVDGFVAWYNDEHLHSGIGYVTPSCRHVGRADSILEGRRRVYDAARRRHPERWNGRPTRAWQAPSEVLLNPATHTPIQRPATQQAA
jgi:transposase InsO family protein